MALSDALTEPRPPDRAHGPDRKGDRTVEDRPVIVAPRHGRWWALIERWRRAQRRSAERAKRTRWVPYEED